MIYRELARRTQNETIIRAGLVLSVDQSLSGARATYEAWTDALRPIVVDAIRSGALQARGACSTARKACPGSQTHSAPDS